MTPPRRKQRGAIDALPSGALRVRVYAGKDPISGRRHGQRGLTTLSATARRVDPDHGLISPRPAGARVGGHAGDEASYVT